MQLPSSSKGSRLYPSSSKGSRLYPSSSAWRLCLPQDYTQERAAALAW